VNVEPTLARLNGVMAGRVRTAEPLSRHTSFRIGGPAALFIECDTVHDVSNAVEILEESGIEWTVLGKGSNVLAADAGYEGAVLRLGREFKRFSIDGEHLRSGAGVLLGVLVQEAFKRGLTGLEFAVGVPGTLGGAVAMNAGSRDVWIGEVVETLTLHAPGIGLTSLRGSEIAWGYRRAGLPRGAIVLEASLRLLPGDTVGIRRTMEASLRRRKRTQPLRMPSAGSVFVNPPGDSAGRLIESAGMKGAVCGGAAVSDVHANFIVNTGSATAIDVLELVARVRTAVREAHGVELTPEIRFLGTFDLS
jgi:UDP-N-acetylmuramate dehydrogenase